MKKVWKALDTLKDVDTGVSGSDAINIIEQALKELEELTISDSSKEESSMLYYNEM